MTLELAVYLIGLNFAVYLVLGLCDVSRVGRTFPKGPKYNMYICICTDVQMYRYTYIYVDIYNIYMYTHYIHIHVYTRVHKI